MTIWFYLYVFTIFTKSTTTYFAVPNAPWRKKCDRYQDKFGNVRRRFVLNIRHERSADEHGNFFGFSAERRKIKEQDTNGRTGRPLELPDEKRAKMTDNGNGMKVVAI